MKQSADPYSPGRLEAPESNILPQSSVTAALTDVKNNMEWRSFKSFLRKISRAEKPGVPELLLLRCLLVAQILELFNQVVVDRKHGEFDSIRHT